MAICYQVWIHLGSAKFKRYCFPFNYIDYEQLDNLVNTHDIGVIKMEVERNLPQKKNF